MDLIMAAGHFTVTRQHTEMAVAQLLVRHVADGERLLVGHGQQKNAEPWLLPIKLAMAREVESKQWMAATSIELSRQGHLGGSIVAQDRRGRWSRLVAPACAPASGPPHRRHRDRASGSAQQDKSLHPAASRYPAGAQHAEGTCWAEEVGR